MVTDPATSAASVKAVGSAPDAAARTGPIAVVVLSHRAPDQVARLASRLQDGSDAVVAIHHDPTGEPLRLRTSSSVALVPDPVPCPWGRPGILIAIRKSLEWVRANVPEFSWVLVISGQDYPIRTVGSIKAELTVTRSDAFLRYFRVDGDPAEDVVRWQASTRRRYLYKRRLPRSVHSVVLPWPRRHPFHDGFRLYAGEQWVNLSAPAVHKLLDSPLNGPVLRYLRRSPNADEAWIPTVLLNGQPELTVVNNRRRYIRWPGGGVYHPCAVEPSDLPTLRASDAFFARKVDPAAWPEACDALDDLARARETAARLGHVSQIIQPGIDLQDTPLRRRSVLVVSGPGPGGLAARPTGPSRPGRPQTPGGC